MYGTAMSAKIPHLRCGKDFIQVNICKIGKCSNYWKLEVCPTQMEGASFCGKKSCSGSQLVHFYANEESKSSQF